MRSIHRLEWRFPDTGESDVVICESPQGAMETISTLHIEAMEANREIVTTYTRTTTHREAHSE